MKAPTHTDPVPRELPPGEIFFWSGNNRYIEPGDSNNIADWQPSSDPRAQQDYILKARRLDDYHLACLKRSIGTTGLLWNPAAPIAVIKVADGRLVAIDGNLRLLAIKELLQDEVWCRAYGNYAARLRKGILVLDFGAWADDADRHAICEHIIAVHCDGV